LTSINGTLSPRLFARFTLTRPNMFVLAGSDLAFSLRQLLPFRKQHTRNGRSESVRKFKVTRLGGTTFLYSAPCGCRARWAESFGTAQTMPERHSNVLLPLSPPMIRHRNTQCNHHGNVFLSAPAYDTAPVQYDEHGIQESWRRPTAAMVTGRAYTMLVLAQ
jgi:hypothetical protein